MASPLPPSPSPNPEEYERLSREIFNFFNDHPDPNNMSQEDQLHVCELAVRRHQDDTSGKEKYTFVGEWLDPELSTAKQFLVHFFPHDNSISLFDIKLKRTFLKRTPIEDVTLKDFYIGGSVRVFGRQININDFACEDTRKKLVKSTERTFAMIKPLSSVKVGEIIQAIEQNKFRIMQMRMVQLTKDAVPLAFENLKEDPDIHGIVENLSSGPIIAMELVSENALSKWIQQIGNKDPVLAEPGSLRNKYGIDKVQNAVYGSTSATEALKDLSYFFPTGKMKAMGPPANALFSNCTCCIIKPHILREGRLGSVLSAIAQEGYLITALKMVYMENANAAEFYEVYKGVVPDYMGMIVELTSGPCVALEIVGPPEVNTPVEFRKLVGPADPDIARQLRPHTLRARFGKTRLQNGVHCSDLPEDGLLEVEYFFKILD